MSDLFTIKAGDEKRSLLYTLPADMDVSTATAVFRLSKDGVRIFEKAAVIVSATQVAYDWASGDLDTLSGDYEGEFTFTYPTTAEETVPSNGYIRIAVTPRL